MLGLLAAPALLGLPRSVRAQGMPEWLAELKTEWAAFRGRYVTREGRVLDTGKGDETHTEGQGFGLLFAAEAGDTATFDRIWDWTRRYLRHRRDNLHAWRYRGDSVDPVGDQNNATDGDILIAWGLMRGADLFTRPNLEREAALIARDILTLCTREVAGKLVLLPAQGGFEKRDHVVVNPSYYVFPALTAFERLVPGPQWRRLVSDGLDLCCREARFGRWGLPADWIEVPRESSFKPRLAASWPTRFSWDAVRVPLYLAWAGQKDNPALQACASFWTRPTAEVPAWTDLRNNSLAPYPGHAGIQAVAMLARATQDPRRRIQELPRVAQAPDYYGASLIMLSRIAWQEARAGAPTV
ncbi:glycosyl hydrolase family 8 [Pararoseomonas indoligenes]|uniref:cellulase n=1 Tax=Roseomonas indoligenes TaxID=2820811 RepID=A0A940MXS5_9PROT|nr:glycosyl hydrolase family 8 [Pararoseomonas indoligenes]MBP0491690.1 glycosyl hydrolase family 5 [Pararoseomonas indoligenes]